MTTMTEQTITIGRHDYNTVQTVTVLDIEGHTLFLTARGDVLEPCGRCYENGTITAFMHVLDGVCFACTGRGYSKNLGTVENATKVMKRRAASAKRAAEKAAAKAQAFIAAREAKYTEWAQANPEIAAALAVRYDAAYAAPEGATERDRENLYWEHIGNLSRDERTLTDLATDAKNAYGSLTEGQMRMVTDILARIDAKATKAQASHHIGQIGEKVTVTGTVSFTKVIDGYYGSKVLVKVEDGTGGTAVMFTTAQWAWEAAQGDAITVTGIVKDHDEYEGVAQTVLNRPKAVK